VARSILFIVLELPLSVLGGATHIPTSIYYLLIGLPLLRADTRLGLDSNIHTSSIIRRPGLMLIVTFPGNTFGSASRACFSLPMSLAQMMQRRFGIALSTQDHEVIRIGDEPSAQALLEAELLPPQHEPAHVKIRQ